MRSDLSFPVGAPWNDLPQVDAGLFRLGIVDPQATGSSKQTGDHFGSHQDQHTSHDVACKHLEQQGNPSSQSSSLLHALLASPEGCDFLVTRVLPLLHRDDQAVLREVSLGQSCAGLRQLVNATTRAVRLLYANDMQQAAASDLHQLFPNLHSLLLAVDCSTKSSMTPVAGSAANSLNSHAALKLLLQPGQAWQRSVQQLQLHAVSDRFMMQADPAPTSSLLNRSNQEGPDPLCSTTRLLLQCRAAFSNLTALQLDGAFIQQERQIQAGCLHALGLLTTLTSLQVTSSCGEFAFKAPAGLWDQLSRLQRLQHMRLPWPSALHGIDLSHATALRSIGIGPTYAPLQAPAAAALATAPGLTCVDVQHCEVIPQDREPVCRSLASIRSLRRLRLPELNKRQHKSGLGLDRMLPHLHNLSQLQELHVLAHMTEPGGSAAHTPSHASGAGVWAVGPGSGLGSGGLGSMMSKAPLSLAELVSLLPSLHTLCVMYPDVRALAGSHCGPCSTSANGSMNNSRGSTSDGSSSSSGGTLHLSSCSSANSSSSSWYSHSYSRHASSTGAASSSNPSPCPSPGPSSAAGLWSLSPPPLPTFADAGSTIARTKSSDTPLPPGLSQLTCLRLRTAYDNPADRLLRTGACYAEHLSRLLQQLPCLRSLTVPFDLAVLQAVVRECSEVVQLGLDGVFARDYGEESLQAWPAALAWLQQLRRLTSLHVANVPLNEEVLLMLSAGLPRLSDLQLWSACLPATQPEDPWRQQWGPGPEPAGSAPCPQTLLRRKVLGARPPGAAPLEVHMGTLKQGLATWGVACEEWGRWHG